MDLESVGSSCGESDKSDSDHSERPGDEHSERPDAESLESEPLEQTLSRLEITGPLDHNTPLCVLEEIAGTHGVNTVNCKVPLDFLIAIQSSAITTVKHPLPKEDLPFVARFVNPRYGGWTRGTLCRAFDWLTQFVEGWTVIDNLKLEPPLTIGLQTKEQPYSLNACVLYRLCRDRKIDLTAETTLFQMSQAVCCLMDHISSVRERLIYRINQTTDREILGNLAAQLTIDPQPLFNPRQLPHVPTAAELLLYREPLPNPTVNHLQLTGFYPQAIDLGWFYDRYQPGNAVQAVAMAAIRFRLDISLAVNPIAEYFNLASRVVDGQLNVIFVDPFMAKWATFHPRMFDMTYHFNPLFPASYYHEEQLRALVYLEGYTAEEIASEPHYQLLQTAYLTETFYLGILPTLKSNVTQINKDDLVELGPNELVSYGQRGQPLVVYSLEELTALFTHNGSFVDPGRRDSVFSSRAITKLRNIANIHPTRQANRELIEIIDSITQSAVVVDRETRILINTYHQSNTKVQNYIDKCLTMILHLAMYMRGWKGSGEFPIESAMTPREEEAQLLLKVAQTYNNFDKLVVEMDVIEIGGIPLSQYVLSLPLYMQVEGQYVRATDPADGMTINDRMNIARIDKDANSCIRISSNWLAASCHKYLIKLGHDCPFDLWKLAHIR